MGFNKMGKEQDSRILLGKSLPPLPLALYRWDYLFCLHKERMFENELRNDSDSLVEKMKSWDLDLFEMERKRRGHDKSRENNHCTLLYAAKSGDLMKMKGS